jgi:hypothetical protein
MLYPALRGPQKEPQGPGPPWWGSRLSPVCFGQCLSVSICDMSSPLNIQRGRSNQTSFFSWLRERLTFAEYCLCLSILLAFKPNDEGGGGGDSEELTDHVIRILFPSLLSKGK